MLKSILAEFRNAARPLCVADLRATLALDTGVIEGMLRTLVQRGRLLEIADAGVCHTCPVRGGCVILNLETAKRYTLPPRQNAPSAPTQAMMGVGGACGANAKR